jgi:activator of Hsp90 ATPase-like protein
MQILKFSSLIDADKRKVWETMLSKETYKEWTKAFHPGSDYEGSWEKGEDIHFIAVTDKGKQGMYSRIKENIKYEFISIEHLGAINNGVIDTTSDEVKKWTPSFENYTFTDKDGKTELKVEVQVEPDYKDMFDGMWPKALNTLKELCEK